MNVAERRAKMIEGRMEEEVRQMKTDDDWGRWPKLPLVNRVTDDLGWLLAGHGPLVFLGNVWGPTSGEEKEVAYNSFEELVKSWRVD